MPREIEVRFKTTDTQKSALLSWVKEYAIHQGDTHHIEHYLDNPAQSFLFTHKLGYKDSDHYLRVRFDEQKGASVCLKVFKIDRETGASENLDEIEYHVDSGEQALKLLQTLGFTSSSIVDKTRSKYKTKDGKFEICFDVVAGVGTFAEVELLEQVDGEISLGFEKIWQFLREIGISEIDEQTRGYVSMLWNPEINFGKVRKL